NVQQLAQHVRRKVDLGLELMEAGIRHKVPWSVLLLDSWYLADELVSMARYHKKDWVSLLKKNRNLETHSFILKDATGKPIPLAGTHHAGGGLRTLVRCPAYRDVSLRA